MINLARILVDAIQCAESGAVTVSRVRPAVMNDGGGCCSSRSSLPVMSWVRTGVGGDAIDAVE